MEGSINWPKLLALTPGNPTVEPRLRLELTEGSCTNQQFVGAVQLCIFRRGQVKASEAHTPADLITQVRVEEKSHATHTWNTHTHTHITTITSDAKKQFFYRKLKTVIFKMHRLKKQFYIDF